MDELGSSGGRNYMFIILRVISAFDKRSKIHTRIWDARERRSSIELSASRQVSFDKEDEREGALRINRSTVFDVKKRVIAQYVIQHDTAILNWPN